MGGSVRRCASPWFPSLRLRNYSIHTFEEFFSSVWMVLFCAPCQVHVILHHNPSQINHTSNASLRKTMNPEPRELPSVGFPFSSLTLAQVQIHRWTCVVSGNKKQRVDLREIIRAVAQDIVTARFVIVFFKVTMLFRLSNEIDYTAFNAGIIAQTETEVCSQSYEQYTSNMQEMNIVEVKNIILIK